MKGWPEVFGTGSREEVSKELDQQELEYTWKKNDDLQVINKTAAVEKHPITGDTIWFNHLMVIAGVRVLGYLDVQGAPQLIPSKKRKKFSFPKITVFHFSVVCDS